MSTPKTVLVTGGCGFIGSHVTDQLLSSGHEVVVLDDLSTGRMANLAEGAIFYCGSVEDRQFVSRVFAQHEFDAVIHEAARINTSVLTEEPRVDTGISITGTINLIEATLKHDAGKFIYASSLAVYGRPETLPVSEDVPPAPIYSYGIAKSCAEEYVRFYGKVHGLDYHIARYGNVFGPRQPVNGEVGVIAIFTDRVLKSEPLVVFGNGEHQRDFIFVEDAAEATLRMIDLPGQDTFNVASGAPVTVNQLFAIFQEKASGRLQRLEKPERPGEIGKYYSSTAKLCSALDWHPRTEIADGIEKTLQYCRSVGMPR